MEILGYPVCGTQGICIYVVSYSAEGDSFGHVWLPSGLASAALPPSIDSKSFVLSTYYMIPPVQRTKQRLAPCQQGNGRH